MDAQESREESSAFDAAGLYGNRDESSRCIEIALKEVNVGNYEKALKFLKKAQSLYATKETEELIESISNFQMNQSNREQSKSESHSTRQRKRSETANEAANENASPEYSSTQMELVKKVNQCKNFYDVLSVPRDASDAVIKKAYKKLALQLHPDKNRAPGAAEAFKTVGNAVSILTDARKRKEYDLLGSDASINGLHSHSNFHQHYHHQTHHRTFDSAFDRDGDISAEELFNMFFGNFPNNRRRTGGNGGAHAHRESGPQPSLAFGLILVLILISMLSSFFTSDPVYSLSQSTKYPVRRETQHLSVPYYVRENFQSDYQGSLGRLENSVEEDFIYTMKQNCYRERSYQEIDDLIEKLKTTSIDSTTDVDKTASLLSEISSTTDPKSFDKFELADSFLSLIKSENQIIQKEAAKCIAEITKSEVQRKKFTNENVINMFVDCLRSVNDTSNLELPIQICRALGNICFLNDEARDIILKIKGDEHLINLLAVNPETDKENELLFIKVRGGLISNYLLGGERVAKRAIDLKIMEKIQNIIDRSIGDVESHEDLLLDTLPLLSILTENVADLNFSSNLNAELARILAVSKNPDLAEMCLELLHYQAENDDVKLLLAKDGLCETIYNLLEKYKNLASTSEARALMKLACELIVLILTGDESMHYLYSTPLLKNMEDWLDSADMDLLTTGVLALGNFARTDSHCIYMVEKKIMNKLLDVLSKNNGVSNEVRLQHALLSALRNLVIPKPNKGAVIQAGLVETILPMLEIHQPPVVFKLLGTLRMTVDGQESLALELLKNKTLIEQLVEWSKSSDYAGVTGESLRLMAWLVKHAYLSKIANLLTKDGVQSSTATSAQNIDESSLKAFVEIDGTVESMVNMLTSQHLVMQNEALIALCILSVVYLSKKPPTASEVDLPDMLIKYDLGRKLAELIRKSSDTMTKEIVENLQNFTTLLKTSDKLVTHLDEHNINELLKSIPILTEYCTL